MYNVELLSRAITAMNFSHHAEERNAAMKFLEAFQNSHDAWQISTTCLSHVDSYPKEVTFFAAQALKHKIVADFSQLSEHNYTEIYELLHSLVYQLSIPKLLRTQLLLALAAFYVQTKLEIRPGNDEQVYVELLSYLPEQLNNRLIHLTDDHFKERKASLLVANSHIAIPVFLKILESEQLRRIGVEGLQNWIHYADLSVEQSIHILQVAVRLLTNEGSDGDDELVEGICELICELSYQNFRNIAFFPSFAHYLPHLCNLLVDGGPTKAVGSMIVECSELFLSNLLESPDLFHSLILTILKLSANEDASIAEMTFNFWTELEVVLENHRALHAAFVPVYTELFRILLPRLQLPPENKSQSAEERESFRDFRHIIGDCLKDCVRVIGSTATVDLIVSAFEQTSQQSHWQPVEAVLFALRTVSSVIDRRESEKLPSLFPTLLSHQHSHPKLVYSTLLVIGCLADWIKYHQEALLPAVEYIFRGLTHQGDTEITAAAAMAMRYLCESCSDLMVKYVEQLLGLYCGILNSGLLDREDQLSLTESICHVIIADKADTASLLSSAIGPLIDKLGSTSSGEAMDCLLEHFALYIELVVPDAISVISTHWPMTEVYLTRIQPIIPTISQQYSHTVSTGISSVLKAAISRYSRSLGQSWLLDVVQMCQRLFHAGSFPSAVYTLRYAVLLGECDAAVKKSIVSDLSANYSSYAGKPLDCLNLIVSIMDYWRKLDDKNVADKTIQLATCLVADPSTDPSELTASIITAIRLADCASSAAYSNMLKTIIRSSLLFFPATVQTDCAVLLHRLGKKDASSVLDPLSSTLASLSLSSREVEVWCGQCLEALKESRPKSLRNALNNWSAAVRRRQ